MGGRYYHRLLGVSLDIPAPDYYQLLGLHPDAVDEASVKNALESAFERLDAAPAADRAVVQHLRRELQRVRATLLDPRRRSEYAEQTHQQRLFFLRRYVTDLLIENTLMSSMENALVARVEALGLPAMEAGPVIDQTLEELGAGRAEDSSDEARRAEADDRVLSVMHAVAEERLLAVVGEAPIDTPRSAPRPRQPEPEPEPEPPQDREVGFRDSADDLDVPPEVRAPEPSRAPEPEPPPRPTRSFAERERAFQVPAKGGAMDEPVPASGIWQDASQIPRKPSGKTGRIEKPDSPRVRGLRQEDYMFDERDRRKARRISRTWLGLLLISLAFAAGDLVAAFVPRAQARVESATVETRGKILASPDVKNYEIGAGAGAAVLLGLMIFLAGREKKIAFLVPTFLLMVPTAYAGLVPIGFQRTVQRERDDLEATQKKTAASLDAEKTRADAAEKLAAERAQKIAELEKKAADQAAQQKAQLDEAAAKQKDLEKKLEDTTKAAQKAAETEKALADKTAKATQLEASLKASDAARAKSDGLVKQLKAENEDLKKKQAPPPPAPR